jgi:hypothetical protein
METVLVDNFGKKEAQDLIGLLNRKGIFAYSKESGRGNISRIKSGHNSEDRYIIVIDQEDSLAALQILNNFREEWIRNQENNGNGLF